MGVAPPSASAIRGGRTLTTPSCMAPATSPGLPSRWSRLKGTSTPRSWAAPGLRDKARHLRARFEADFWLDREAFYALALDGEGAPCRVVSSNPAHCLWAGIAASGRARAMGARLLADDMFSGWGLRRSEER